MSNWQPAAHPPLVLYGRRGGAPGIILVARDEAGQLRSASWALHPTEDPRRTESAPRRLARGGAALVDLVTMPMQLLLLVTGVVRVH